MSKGTISTRDHADAAVAYRIHLTIVVSGPTSAHALQQLQELIVELDQPHITMIEALHDDKGLTIV